VLFSSSPPFVHVAAVHAIPRPLASITPTVSSLSIVEARPGYRSGTDKAHAITTTAEAEFARGTLFVGTWMRARIETIGYLH
jgi:hypothetical protein